MTDGQKLLKKAKSDLEWAVTLLDESATPFLLDVEKLVETVRQALTVRLRERQGPR